MRQQPPSHQVQSALTSAGSKDADMDPDHISSPIIEMLDRIHVLVVGPGLGRDPLMQATVARVLRAARERRMPVVLDADALQLVQRDPALVRGNEMAVLTPNVVEFGRLCDALGVTTGEAAEGEPEGDAERAQVEALAKKLEGPTIVQKGMRDLVSDGTTTLVVDLEGGKKRSGGQGDTLTGSIATFLGWRKAYLDGLWEEGGGRLPEKELVGLAAFGGSAVTKVSDTGP